MQLSAWFDSWDSLFKILVGSLVGYVVLILFVRIAGKRSTSRMNNFDWIVTVAVGSVMASMAILEDVTVSDGALAMALLLGFQFLLTTATARWQWAERLFSASPTVLYAHGEFRRAAMKSQRISEQEIISAVRESGQGSLQAVHAVILEPDAQLSIVSESQNDALDAVKSVPGYDQLAATRNQD